MGDIINRAVKTRAIAIAQKLYSPILKKEFGFDFLMKLSAKGKYYIEVAVLFLIVVPALIFWDSPFIFPVKVFVVLLHESSHAIAALVTGGTVTEININNDLGGNCISVGGYVPLIACAGYIGSLLSGALLLYASMHNSRGRIVCYFFALIFIFSMFFLKSFWVIAIALVFTALFIISPIYLPGFIHRVFMSVLGTLISLYALIDIREDLFTSGYIQTDAHLMAASTGIPALAWSIFWFAVSLLILFFIMKKKFRHERSGGK